MRISVGEFVIGLAERRALDKVINSGRISESKMVRKFEQLWSEYIGTKYAVALNSGTSALISGLTALTYIDKYNLKKRKKVITTPLTYIADSNALLLTGFEPVYVDVCPQTFVITPSTIQSHLEEVKDSKNYGLVLPVHLMGYACDMDEIGKIAAEYGLIVVEDAAQAHGTLYKDKKVGSMGEWSVYSFYIAHNIQAGEMGALNTNSPEVAQIVRQIKANGRVCGCPLCLRMEGNCPDISHGGDDNDPRFTHEYVGYNFKTTEFSAALAYTQLKKADAIFSHRNRNVKYLNDKLNKFSAVLQLPFYSEKVSYLAYPLVIKDPKVISRRELREFLEKKGVETRPLFGCIPLSQPSFSHLRKKYKGRLPNAEYIAQNGFYIGCHQYLKKEDLDYIVYVFEKFFERI
jgi:dTDP-4-amino-4,6-dideoxygalactose transaminase